MQVIIIISKTDFGLYGPWPTELDCSCLERTRRNQESKEDSTRTRTFKNLKKMLSEQEPPGIRRRYYQNKKLQESEEVSNRTRTSLPTGQESPSV